MSDSIDPYYRWLGIPTGEQPPNHYRLLGIQLFEKDPDVMENAALPALELSVPLIVDANAADTWDEAH